PPATTPTAAPSLHDALPIFVPVPILGDELPAVEVLAKMECLNPGGSLKDRPVLRMLLTALADGRLPPGKTVLDSSSGNAGIAYRSEEHTSELQSRVDLVCRL